MCPIYVGVEDIPEARSARAVEAMRRSRARCASARVAAVRTGADLDDLGDRIGLVLSLEGCEPLGSIPEAIDVFYELGVRAWSG